MTEVCVLTPRRHVGWRKPPSLALFVSTARKGQLQSKEILLPLERGRTMPLCSLKELFSCGSRCLRCSIFLRLWQCLWFFSAFGDYSCRTDKQRVMEHRKRLWQGVPIEQLSSFVSSHTCFFKKQCETYAITGQWKFSYKKKKIPRNLCNKV